MTKFQKGMFVKHVEYGKGVIAAICDDINYAQVEFVNAPPKPKGYRGSSNPYVVRIDSLESSGSPKKLNKEVKE